MTQKSHWKTLESFLSPLLALIVSITYNTIVFCTNFITSSYVSRFLDLNLKYEKCLTQINIATKQLYITKINFNESFSDLQWLLPTFLNFFFLPYNRMRKLHCAEVYWLRSKVHTTTKYALNWNTTKVVLTSSYSSVTGF